MLADIAHAALKEPGTDSTLPSPGESAMLWSVRLSMLLLAVVFWRWWFAAAPSDPIGTSAPGTADFAQAHRSRRRTAVLMGTAWLLCVIHVLLAFHIRHHWKLSEAEQHTARVTAQVTGIHWGGGLYINFAFLGWWGGEVVLRWFRPNRSSRVFQAAALFMVFNATAVFGPRWWIVAVAIFIVASIVVARATAQRHRHGPPQVPRARDHAEAGPGD